MWPIFGVVWDAGRILATLMMDQDIEGLRILEVGCGIGLASLVLNHREADVTATDRHPQAKAFLEANTELNGGAPIPFERHSWSEQATGMGQFDVIIGSDLLYEREQAAPLSAFIERHARPVCEVILVDAGRGQTGRFTKAMAEHGFSYQVSRAGADSVAGTMQVHGYHRG